MSLSKMRTAVYEWRARPEAMLVPALLQALALGLNNLPSTYLFRTIRCEEYAASLPSIPPEMGDICRSPAVQKAYSADMAVYVTIATVMGIILSGPYGSLSDLKGRKRALLLAASLNALGDSWLVICALNTVLRRPWILQFGAVLQGLAGGFSVLISAQNAFIADTTRPTERSWYLGLSLVMLWTGGAVGPLISAPLTNRSLYATNFMVTVAMWILYLLYLVFVLRETRVPSGERDTSSILSVLSASSDEHTLAHKPILRLMVRTFVEPLRVIATNRILLLPCIGIMGTILAGGVYDFVVPYCDSQFGLSPNEAGVLWAVMSVSRAITVLLILPTVLACLDHWLKRRSQSQTEASSASTDERTPLLQEGPEDDTAAEANLSSDQDLEVAPKIEQASVTRELVMVRLGLVMDAIGMLLLWRSRNALEVNIATTVGSLGAPALPSMQALVTIGAPQEEIGRVLAGVSVLTSLAVALRNPVFFPLFQATLEKMPGAIFWLSAAIYALCSVLMLFLRPKQYVK